MKSTCIVFLILIFYFTTQGQNINKFIDANINSEKELIDYGTFYIIQKLPKGEFVRKIIDHKTGMVTHHDTYLRGGVNAKKNGLSIRRTFDGRVVSKGLYLNGKKTGIWIENIFDTGNYKEDQRDGIWRIYNGTTQSALIAVELKNGTTEEILDLKNTDLTYSELFYNNGYCEETPDHSISINDFINKNCLALGMEGQELADCSLVEIEIEFNNLLTYALDGTGHIQDMQLEFKISTTGTIESCEVVVGLNAKNKKRMNKKLKDLLAKFVIKANAAPFHTCYLKPYASSKIIFMSG